MKETINYYYNIYPSKIVEINNGCYFYFNDFKYYFVETSKSIEEIEFLVKVTNSLYKRNIFVDTFIINKNKTFYVALNDKTYVLLRVNSLENDKYSLKDLIYFNNLLILKNNNVVPYDVLWGKKIDVFESEMADLNIDYPLIQESFDYYVGLAENAISYYVDIKETENMNDAKVSLGHKRLNKYVLSGLINNSINFTFDYEIRDTALYIETKFFDGTLDLEEVVETLKKFNRVNLRLLFSRLLYPVYYFDQVKLILEEDVDEKTLMKFISKSRDYEMLLFDVFSMINKKYNIPKVEWLENT